MDYYIGTLLFWKGSKKNFEYLSCQPLFGFSHSNRQEPEYIVLDGQQRLTAMHYAFFAPNVNFPNRKNPYLFFVDIRKLLDEDYDEAFYYDRMTKNNKHIIEDFNKQYENHILPLSIFKEGSWGISDWIKGYRDYWGRIYDGYDLEAQESESVQAKREALIYYENSSKLRDMFEDLLGNYEISYIELDRNIEIAKVCDIFTQINSKGIQLDIFDLLNAMLRPKEIFLKKMWHEIKDDVSYTDPAKMKIYILQVMSILVQTYCSSKYLYYLVPGAQKTIKDENGSKKQIVLIKSEEEFIQKWNESYIAIKKSIQILKNPRDFGAIKPDFVPYPSIISAFSAIRRHVDMNDYQNKADINKKIREWYWASIFLNRYSSSVETTSAKDFTDLKRWFTDPEDVPECIQEIPRHLDEMNLHRERKGSAIYKAIFNILILNGAKDWHTYELPEYEDLDDHHIVPASWGKKHVGDDIHSIMNRVPISSDTNRKIIRDNLPNTYMKTMFENNDQEEIYRVLESHLISRKCVEILLRNPFSKEDYYEFLFEREKNVMEYIKENLFYLAIDMQKLNKNSSTI